jgi:hypothetical protein
MTTHQIFGATLLGLRGEADKLLVTIAEVERLVEQHAELDITGLDRAAPTVSQTINEAASRVLQHLTNTMPGSLQALAYSVQVNAIGAQNASNQAWHADLAAKREERDRQERVAEVAAATARAEQEAERERELLEAGDPDAYARWKRRNGGEVPAGTAIEASFEMTYVNGKPTELVLPKEVKLTEVQGFRSY